MNARETALRILLEFEREASRLDDLIDKHLKAGDFPARERKFIFNLVSGVVRHRSLFDWKIASLFNGNYKKTLKNFKLILCLGLYELDFLDHIPPHATLNEYVSIAKKKLPAANFKTVNGVLRTYLREGRGLDPYKKFKYMDTKLAVKYSFPEWLIKRWLGIWNADFVQKMCEALNERPLFGVRINRLKIDNEKFINALIEADIKFVPSEHFADMFRISDIQTLIRAGMLQKGLCTIQDESGFLVTQLIDPVRDDLVLDSCAAPGGKYTALVEKNRGVKIIALEPDAGRVLKIRENCRRSGLPDSTIIRGDGRSASSRAKTFDHILVDAPCSGFGAVQKHPDIKWRRTLQEIFQFQILQLEILRDADRMLKSGGNLVYSTCTIDPAENEAVVEEFLNQNPGKYQIIPPPESFQPFTVDNKFVRTFPHKHHMEGSFAVKLQKV